MLACFVTCWLAHSVHFLLPYRSEVFQASRCRVSLQHKGTAVTVANSLRKPGSWNGVISESRHSGSYAVLARQLLSCY